jgi:hypothetical protein
LSSFQGDEMKRSKWKTLITVAVTTMMATMDASITNIAFPVLTRVFDTDLSVVMWVSVAFVLEGSTRTGEV